MYLRLSDYNINYGEQVLNFESFFLVNSLLHGA